MAEFGRVGKPILQVIFCPFFMFFTCCKIAYVFLCVQRKYIYHSKDTEICAHIFHQTDHCLESLSYGSLGLFFGSCDWRLCFSIHTIGTDSVFFSSEFLSFLKRLAICYRSPFASLFSLCISTCGYRILEVGFTSNINSKFLIFHLHKYFRI